MGSAPPIGPGHAPAKRVRDAAISQASFIAASAVPTPFHFVDRITAIDCPGVTRGQYVAPDELPDVSACLIAEAVGQLAAWAAMAQSGFRLRPVAALTREARFLSSVPSGATIDLVVEIESVNRDAVVYSGWAQLNGRAVLELRDCVGAMMPIEELDDPSEVEARFKYLCSPENARAASLSPFIASVPTSSVVDHERGLRIEAQLQVPISAPLFADHFPRKPVFPATLLLDALLGLAHTIAPAPGADTTSALRMEAVRGVKMRSFVVPGDLLRMTASVKSRRTSATEVDMGASVEGKRVCTARVAFVEVPHHEP